VNAKIYPFNRQQLPVLPEGRHRPIFKGIRIPVIVGKKLFIKGATLIAQKKSYSMFSPSVYSWHVFNRNGDYEQLLLRIATGFVSVSPQDFKRTVAEALEAVGSAVKVDRLYVYNYDFEQKIAYNSHEWCADGIFPLLDRNEPIPFAKLSDILELHLDGKTVFIPNLYNPADEKADIYFFEEQVVRSIALFPMLHNEECLGFIGSDMNRNLREFNEQDLFALKALAEILTCAELRCRVEAGHMELEKKYIDLVEQTSDWVWEVNSEICFTYANKHVENITGYKPEELLGKTPFSFMEPAEAKKVEKIIADAFARRESLKQVPNKFIHKDGSVIYFETSGVPVFNASGAIAGYRGITRDVTARVKDDQKLAYLSLHDRLTGVYNRAYFEEELSRLENSRDYPITMLYADVNGLKMVNDAFGHEKGDELLKTVAKVLKNSLRKPERLARIGGDEFAAVMVNTGEAQGQKIVSRIRANIARYNKETRSFPLGVSIGVATAESRDVSLADLFRKADDMMYRDKIMQGRECLGTYIEMNKAKTESGGPDQDRHLNRLVRMCRVLGQRLGLGPKKLSDLVLLAKAHNLGTAGIPDKIFYKQDRLSNEEQSIMRLHPEKGYRIALASSKLSGIADLFLKHHEWWDGTGYPLGLKATAIPMECRILAVAEAFLMLVTGCADKNALSNAEALDQLQKLSGSRFDPQVVEALVLLYEEAKQLKNERRKQPVSR
jgi:diguanylate cyclase (GGDEF)-like protein/PAS domain S-box-containing protein